jgi:hypothetical protein
MSINHHPPRYEELAAPAALRSQYEGRPPQRRQVRDLRSGPPASGLPAAPPGTPSIDDTPLYWQTVQAMAAGRWRRDGLKLRGFAIRSALPSGVARARNRASVTAAPSIAYFRSAYVDRGPLAPRHRPWRAPETGLSSRWPRQHRTIPHECRFHAAGTT